MGKLNKTRRACILGPGVARAKRQRRQRTRSSKRRSSRRQRGGSLPVPAGSVVAVSTGGEYGVPVLMTREQYDESQEGMQD